MTPVLKPASAKPLRYGTAGFRTKAADLDYVAYRVGIAAALRAQQLGASVGVMITASHNPVEDNGMKIIDPSGEMLAQEWESHVTALVNAENDEVDSIITSLRSNHLSITQQPKARLIVARDTRPSGERLLRCLTEGAESMKVEILDFGLLTTPQLHFMLYTKCLDDKRYFEELAGAYKELIGPDAPNRQVYLDCACGIAALKYANFNPLIRSLEIVGFNDSTDDHLNENCGADFVKVKQALPQSHNGAKKFAAGQNCASADGDADRLVYFYLGNDLGFRLLDGDKIATLLSSFIINCLKEASLESEVKLAVIQTAYANGSSTKFLTDVLKVPVVCVPTGVKHLHHEAAKYDIGVYFEANGHGTILFSKNFLAKLQEPAAGDSAAKTKLLSLAKIMNQATGDAFSLLLAAEAVLSATKQSIQDWDAMYEDLPCLQLKVNVADRYVIETFDAERKVSKPPGLQNAIDALVAKHNGRAFARPSGTEDVVRVYAEAPTKETTQKLATDVAVAVYDLAGGVGPKPS